MQVCGMFYHAFDGYMDHAFPRDELRPLSCEGEDTLGGYALTLIDSLDTLALLGDRERFISSVEWISKNLRFDINKTVSVFETTIRILGGLISAHLIASDYATNAKGRVSKSKMMKPNLVFVRMRIAGEKQERSSIPVRTLWFSMKLPALLSGTTRRFTGMRVPAYDDELLNLAEDLARRLLPAFHTPTGIPFGSVNLLHGVDESESKAKPLSTCFEQLTKNAVRGLWARRSRINLVGAHIDVFTGEWTQKDAGIGTSIDSFYEYLLKAYLLFGDDEYLFIFQEAYGAAMHYLFNDPWYVEVNMNSAALVWPLFNSLQAFWPGLQVLAGDIDPAIRTHTAFFSVWKRYGFTPEGFNLATLSVQHGQKSYPLRPELMESTYWLYKATRDPRYLDVGRDMVASLQYGARCACGYCHISDVEFHKQEDHMESFFLAETVKYLWLLFDLAAGPDNLVENGPYKYIFSTEGHLLPATPQISLVREHCSYVGAYCRSSNLTRESYTLDISKDDQETNGSGFRTSLAATRILSRSSFQKSTSVSGLIKGLCPGLTHEQKYGIPYMTSTGTKPENEPPNQGVDTMVESHSVVVLPNSTSKHLPTDVQKTGDDDQESGQEGSEGSLLKE
ncbi:hypothetical protein RJ639_002070 [Escallonia herrerae]|uniref:alpha-1,2-Mannosidase n=1 Tax=Escallonia herrerae TaxID=1293975 RepID=A0AA88XB56_9ASTE|nr:hypothetical protein RJ639_002070 [Escallonia herrerae]